METMVLRLGHRLPRDERISTHVALVARAFGAGGIIYSGQHDSSLEQSVKRISERWGRDFSIRYERNPLRFAAECKKAGFKIAHLTMYGIPLPEKLPELAKCDKILVIVGSEQVPREFYEIADFNISITSQPHSEVAALAIMLDRLAEGKELLRSYSEKFRGKISIEPSERGKRIKRAQAP